jgi:ArsR family metal-binding transcriptional regulator
MNQTTSNNRKTLIEGFDIEMVSPACHPGAEQWNAQAHLNTDIRDVLPYLNARFEEAQYDHKAQVLLLKRNGKKSAFRPNLISTAPVFDREEGQQFLTELIALVNETWRDRHSLEPSYERKELPTVMEIYRQLPRTNCKECGYPTCMAFAAAVRDSKVDLDCCPLTHSSSSSA